MQRNKKVWPVHRKKTAISRECPLQSLDVGLLIRQGLKSAILNMFKELEKTMLKN